MYYLYRFLNEQNEIIYVGRTNNLNSRMSQHFSRSGHLPASCYAEVARVDVLSFVNKNDMIIAEIYYISKYETKYNIANVGPTEFNIDTHKHAWVIYDHERPETFDNKISKVEISKAKYQALKKELKEAKYELEYAKAVVCEKEKQLEVLRRGTSELEARLGVYDSILKWSESFTTQMDSLTNDIKESLCLKEEYPTSEISTIDLNKSKKPLFKRLIGII